MLSKISKYAFLHIKVDMHWSENGVFLPVGAVCSPRGKVMHSDGSGQMRIYTPSVISELKRHLASTDPELGGPLENLVLSSSSLKRQFTQKNPVFIFVL